MVEVPKFKCQRCGHEWVPRTSKDPTVCPDCKSPYWKTPASPKKAK